MDKAQGTIEYLVILAVIVVVSLVVVSLLVNSTSGAEGISSGTSQIASSTSPIAIAESVVSEDGNYLLKIENNTGENVTVKDVNIGSSAGGSNLNKTVAPSANQVFVLSSEDVCVDGQQVVSAVTITYETVNGLLKTQVYPVPVGFDCGDYGVESGYVDETGAEFDEEGNEVGGETGSTILQVTGEPLSGGAVQNFPMLTSSGEAITNLTELEQAYANGDIVIYEDGVELSVSGKESSRLARFTPTGEADGDVAVSGADYIGMSSADCSSLSGNSFDYYSIVFSSVSSGYESYLDTSHNIISDQASGYIYLDDCSECWETGESCALIDNFDITTDTSGGSDITTAWQADLYEFELSYDTPYYKTIELNPLTGEIDIYSHNRGLGSITVDYYYDSA